MEWMLLSHICFLLFSFQIWAPLLTCILNCFRECAGQCRHPEMHVKCTTWNGGKITHIKIFFSSFWTTLIYIFKILLFSFACCGAMAIMWQARIAHCSVHCSCFFGVGGKTETALTPLFLPPFSSRKGASQCLLSAALLLQTHNYTPLCSPLQILPWYLCRLFFVFSTFPTLGVGTTDTHGLLLHPRLLPFCFTSPI